MNYEVSIERNINSVHLVVTGESIHIEPYHLKMILYKQTKNLLNCHVQMDDTVKVYYDVTSKRRLIDYLKEESIRYDMLKALLTQISSLYRFLHEHLLNEEACLLDVNMIWLNADTSEFYFVYIPTSQIQKGAFEQLQDLTKALIPYIHKQDVKAVGLIHKIHVMLHDAHMGLEAIKSIVDNEADTKAYRAFDEPVIQKVERRKKSSATKKEKKTSKKISSKKLTSKINKDKEEPVSNSKWGLQIPTIVNEPTEVIGKKLYLVTDKEVMIPITKSSFLIGQQRELADYCIENRHVSRLHCKVIKEDFKYSLVDLNSTNGTIINGIPLTPLQPYPITDGAELIIGEVQMWFRYI